MTRLDAYHFYEDEWESYDQLLEAFAWETPKQFNMATYICDRWADDRGRVALFAENKTGREETYTFWQLRNYANSLANYLAEQGVEFGDRVGINAPQRAETAIAHIACWKLGAVSVPLSTLFGTDALRYRLSDSNAVACLIDQSNIETFRQIKNEVNAQETIITIGDVDQNSDEVDFWNAVENTSRRYDTTTTDAEDDAIIIYTSGTTGDPKGVRHAHRVLLGNLPLFITTFCNMELYETDVFWTPSEWAWVATLFDILFPGLFYGRPVVAYNSDEKFDPEIAMQIIEKYGVTNYFAPPTALRMMMQLEETEQWDVSSVRCVPSGGEALGETIVEWGKEVFDGAAVHEAYGQTEANMIVGDCTALTEFREGKIGRRGPGHEIAIVDPQTAEPLDASNEVGEIAVRYEGNPVCFKEYWNKPEKTAEKVKNGWLLTEDLGRLDADGYLEFVSRKDTVIISAGYRIGPVEIEEALAAHPAVADAGVIGVPDEERGEVPKAFVVLSEDYGPSDDLCAELKQDVRDRLAEYEYPRHIEFIDELPKTTSGKVRRTALEEREGL